MTRRIISVAEFIQTGAFGPLAIDSRDEVVSDLLGEPYDVGQGIGKASILQYGHGRLEVSTLKKRVVVIAFYPFKGCGLAGQDWVADDLSSRVYDSPDAFVSWLKKWGLPFRSQSEDGIVQRLIVQGGATVTFVDGGADSLQVS